MSWIAWIVVGAVAGFLASKIVGSKEEPLRRISSWYCTESAQLNGYSTYGEGFLTGLFSSLLR